MKIINKKLVILITILWIIIFSTCNKGEPAKMNETKFLNRAQSFSFILLNTNLKDEIINLLKNNNYTILSSNEMKTNYNKLIEALDIETEDTNIVYKSVFEKNNYTVLIDPEMVVFTFEDQLLKLAKDKNTTIITAMWERFSQSAILILITAEGIVSRTSIMPGQQVTDNINPNKILLQKKSDNGIIEAILGYNIPINDIFNNELNATILKLKE